MFRIFRLFTLFLLPLGLFSSEVINNIIAIVGKTPITYLDLKDEMRHLKPSQTDYRNAESRALDNLIENAIVDSVVKQEVISVPESQIDETIKKTMESNGIPDEKTFEQILLQQLGLTLDEYKAELKKKLKIQQIIQLKISMATPKEDEVRQFYNLHKNEFGNSYFLKAIYKSFDANNPKQELAVSKEMAQARTEAVFNFANAVQKYSEDKSGDGSMGWMRTDEMFQKDPMLANVVSRLNQGDVSMVFVSKDRYYIVKVEKVRPITLEEATPLIMQRIFGEKQQKAYENWLEDTKKSTAIKIMLENYQKRK